MQILTTTNSAGNETKLVVVCENQSCYRCVYVSWKKLNDIDLSQMIVSTIKGNITKDVIMHIIAIITRHRNCDIVISDKDCFHLQGRVFKQERPCLDKVITTPCYNSIGFVENSTKILNIYILVMIIYCFYYRTLSKKYKFFYTVSLVKQQNKTKTPWEKNTINNKTTTTRKHFSW